MATGMGQIVHGRGPTALRLEMMPSFRPRRKPEPREDRKISRSVLAIPICASAIRSAGDGYFVVVATVILPDTTSAFSASSLDLTSAGILSATCGQSRSSTPPDFEIVGVDAAGLDPFAVDHVLDQAVDRDVGVLHHARHDMAGRDVALVDIDADRVFVGGSTRLQHAFAGRAGDVEDDVGALAVERHGQLAALGRIVEGPGEDGIEANVGRRGLGALLVSGEEIADHRDVAAADEADRLAVAESLDRAALLGHQAAERAGQERALVLGEVGIDDVLGVEHAVDEDELAYSG